MDKVDFFKAVLTEIAKPGHFVFVAQNYSQTRTYFACSKIYTPLDFNGLFCIHVTLNCEPFPTLEQANVP